MIGQWIHQIDFMNEVIRSAALRISISYSQNRINDFVKKMYEYGISFALYITTATY